MVRGCSNCHRLISVSNVPGGNPRALADPEQFAMSYGKCGGCGRVTCDRCINGNNGKCPNCGEKVRVVQGHP